MISESGKLIWERDFIGTYDHPQLKIIDGQIFLRLTDKDLHTDHILYSLDPKTGDTLWTFNKDLQYGELHYTIQGEHIFLVTSKKFLFSLDRRTGQVAWYSHLAAEPIYLLENQSVLLVVTEDGHFSAHDENTGIEVWNTAVDIHRLLFMDEDEANQYFRIDSGKLLIAGDTPWIKTFDIKTGKQTKIWNHNNRYQWLPGADYGLGLFDGQFLYITIAYGRFFEVGSGFHRIIKVNPETLLQE